MAIFCCNNTNTFLIPPTTIFVSVLQYILNGHLLTRITMCRYPTDNNFLVHIVIDSKSHFWRHLNMSVHPTGIHFRVRTVTCSNDHFRRQSRMFVHPTTHSQRHANIASPIYSQKMLQNERVGIAGYPQHVVNLPNILKRILRWMH